jgi:cyanophycinase
LIRLKGSFKEIKNSCEEVVTMKLQQVLPSILVLLVAANDKVNEASGALRGSAIRDDAQKHRQAQLIKPPLEPEAVPADDPSPAVDPEPVEISSTEETDPTEAPVTAAPTANPVPVTAAPTGNPINQFVFQRPPTSPPVSNPTIAPRPTIDGLLPPSPTLPPVNPTPPIRQQPLDVNGNVCGMSTPGTVILHGGIFNYDDPLADSLGQTIVQEMRTNSDNQLLDPFVFLPGARRDVSDEDEAGFESQWQNIMAPNVQFSVLHADDVEADFTNVADAAQADTDGFVRPLLNAGGVFLPGGRQWRLIDAYKYTQTEDQLWKVLERGGVVAGTSAGAAVMASYMPRGDPSGSNQFIADREWYQHGFGFVSNIAIDNHVTARGRENAMYEAMNDRLANRKLLGLGLNENTMAIVKGRYFQVQGDRGPDSQVRVYDCSNIGEFETCSFENAPYVTLSEGNWYDLCAREQMSAPPVFNDLDEDLGTRAVLGAYNRPWEFKKDFKAGNPNDFLCSGRRCVFKSSPIVVDSDDRNGNIVRITGKVYSQGTDFVDADNLKVKFRLGDSGEWSEIYNDAIWNSYFSGRNSPFGQNIYYAFRVPDGKSEMQIEIEAESSAEGSAEFQVQSLKIQ